MRMRNLDPGSYDTAHGLLMAVFQILENEVIANQRAKLQTHVQDVIRILDDLPDTLAAKPYPEAGADELDPFDRWQRVNSYLQTLGFELPKGLLEDLDALEHPGKKVPPCCQNHPMCEHIELADFGTKVLKMAGSIGGRLQAFAKLVTAEDLGDGVEIGTRVLHITRKILDLAEHVGERGWCDEQEIKRYFKQ